MDSLENLLPLVARNSFFEATGKLSIKLIAFIITIFIIRWLGDEDYGRYTLIWSYVVVFSMLSDVGLGMYAIRGIAEKKSDSQTIAGNIILIRVILAVIAIGLTLVTVWLAGYSGEFLEQVFLASLILLLYAVQDPFDAVLQANERFDISTAAILAGQLAFIGAGVLFLWLGWHITGFIVARLLNVMVTLIISWKLLAGYRHDLQWQLKPALWPAFIRASVPFGLIKLWINWSARIDLIILAWFLTEEIVGRYGAAQALVLGIIVISSSINAALYPSLSREYTRNSSLMPKIYELALKYLLVIALPIAGGLSLVADKVITLLYGLEFAPAATAFAILIWIFPLVAISELLRYGLLVANQEKMAVRSLVFAALLNVGLNLWLVPRYGFLATAVTAIIAEALLVVLYLRQLRFELKSLNLSDVLIKPLLATLILMNVVNLVSAYPLFIQIMLGGLIYMVLIWLLKVVKPAEFKSLLYGINPVRETSSSIQTVTPPQSLPLVSVFIPAYNAERFVAQAIESVLAQTYPNYELIAVNDGSTDGTAEILKRYQGHPRLTIHHNPRNVGMTANWNIGLALCRGELIAKLDADDFYEPEYLETVVEFFHNHETAGLVFTGLNLIYADGRCEPEMKSLRSWVCDRDVFLPILLRSCIIRSPTVCVRRACYDELGGFLEQMHLHSDWEMWVRIAANYPAGFIARRLANYRTSYGSNCTAQALVNGQSVHDIRLWLDLLENNQLPYRLSTHELAQFRWGIYNLEMHFAGIATYQHDTSLQEAYTTFAEETFFDPSSPVGLREEMRWTYINLHQGIHAFQENQLYKAIRFFFQAIKVESGKLPRTRRRLSLTFNVIKRIAIGFYRRAIVKYYPGL